MNSPSTNLAMHYPSGPGASNAHQQQRQPQQKRRPTFNPITNQYDPQPPQNHFQHQMRTNSNGSVPQVTSFPGQATGPANSMPGTSDADLLLNLHSPYNAAQSNAGSSPAFPNSFTPSNDPHQAGFNNLASANWNYGNLWNSGGDFAQGLHDMQPFGDMMIESQDVDMSMLGLDMMPWFDNFSGENMLFGGDARQVGDGSGPPGEGTPHGG